MNTIDLINRVAVENNITAGRAEMIISIVIERISEKLKRDGMIDIENFGKFSIAFKKPFKAGDNPQLFKNHVMFEPDKTFLENLNS
jgi:nucleoid DNA-binding protein